MIRRRDFGGKERFGLGLETSQSFYFNVPDCRIPYERDIERVFR